MKASSLKIDSRVEQYNDRGLGVQNYGENNDYPQRTIEIVNASGTGKSSVNIYAKFIAGRGFVDENFLEKIINKQNQTLGYLLEQVSKDYAIFGGFALHVNYNANFQVVQVHHVPLEQVRFSAVNPDTGFFDKLAIHPDWGRRCLALRRWKKSDITFIDFFSPNKEEITQQVEKAGGWANYKGQVLYYSNEGDKVYPLPIFDCILTDMSTEEGVSNVSYRNARYNFLTAGMLISYYNNNRSAVNRGDDDSLYPDKSEINNIIKEFQGDSKAGRILSIELEEGESKPEFVPFKGENYDKEFTSTLAACQTNIGKAFNQPPILRSENVGANFGADLMLNAYNFYNSTTQSERIILERVFMSIFSNWKEPMSNNYSIAPLTYEVEMTLADKLGEKQLIEMIAILNNESLLSDAKKSICKTLFGLTQEEVNNLILTKQAQ